MTPPRLSTVAAVAAQLARSACSVYRLIAAGDLVAVGKGRGLRIRQDSVDRWIEVNTVRTPGAGRAA